MDAWRGSATEVWAPTASEMEAIDRAAVSGGHTSERVLIEAAGRELAHRISAGWPEGPVCGLVGSGHNGADVIVALRTLAAWGRTVRAVLSGGPPEPDLRAGFSLPLESADGLHSAPPTGGVLVDGLLGTGAAGAPREEMAELIERANSLGLPIVSADLPSGADPTSGAVPGACIRADLTVCFGWPKLGLLRYPAREYAGRIEAVEIGFPPIDADGAASSGVRPGARVITARWVARMLRPRPGGGHKGTSGFLLLASGTSGMAGASVLAARAACRAGAGIVRVLGHPDNREIVQRGVPGAVFSGWDGDGLPADVEWAHALAIGPGLGGGAGARTLVERLLAGRGDRPVVLDADGLNAFAGDALGLAAALGAADVITPHPGELDRLMGEADGIDVEGDPVSAARAAAETLGCTVVLKGNPTVVAGPVPRAPLRVTVTGGPAFAVGGTGDVLTGTIGALLAAGMPGPDAASAALMLGGLAAEASGFGDVGMVAEDLPEHLPAAREAIEALPSAGPPGAVRFVAARMARPGVDG